MTYLEFQRQLGKAGLSAREFADLVRMSPNSLTNYARSKRVPAHLAIIATLMAEMAEHRIDFRAALSNIEIEPKRPRGVAASGRTQDLFSGQSKNVERRKEDHGR